MHARVMSTAGTWRFLWSGRTGLELRVWGLGFGVWGLGFRV